MTGSLINPADSVERQNRKLIKIVETLMRRVEQDTDAAGDAYAQFQRAALLEDEVRARTRELERALDLLNESNARLAEANRETEAARANLANAIETVQEGFALFDPHDRLVMCNSRFGMHMPDIHPRLKPGLGFADYVAIVAASPYLSLPPDQSPADWAAQRMAHHARPGAMFNVRLGGRRWLQVSERRTPDGGTVILQTDVTDIVRLERRERERILDDQARLVRATLEHLQQGVCIFDAETRLVGWNRQVGRLLAIPVGRFPIGTSFAAILGHMRDNYRFAGPVGADQVAAWAGHDGRRSPLKFDITGADDRVLTVFMRQMPDGGFVISLSDVSAERAAIRTMAEAKQTLEQRVLERTLELEDALAEAERANASKSRFVAAASHDLLQPLSAAKLYLATLEGDLADPGPRATLGKAARALQSVEHILGALLDISKLDSGQAQVHVAPVALDRMLGQLRDEMLPVARAKRLDLRVLRTGARVASDATYLRRILQNLISNAIRYTDRGRVLVGARQFRNTIRLEVWDTGPGIAEEEQERIFGEFQRLHATASAADGMGLGLAIVDRACALLRHPLMLRSWPGRGTVFSVELPRAAPEPAGTGAAAPPPAPAGAPGATGTITAALPRPGPLVALLIENDAELRQALGRLLESWGIEALACAGATEAEALLAEIDISPDVIIADMQLDAGASGAAAIAGLRARHGAALPACLISADRGTGPQAAARDLGVPLLHKPIDTARLRRFLAGLG